MVKEILKLYVYQLVDELTICLGKFARLPACLQTSENLVCVINGQTQLPLCVLPTDGERHYLYF